jgi:hypothetical protein
MHGARKEKRMEQAQGEQALNVTSVNVTRNTNARNALHKFIAQSVADSMSIRDLFYQVVGATGNSYDGASAFILNGTAPGGPKEDRFDMMLYKSASTFLGLGHYDCLLCHNGRGHLEDLGSSNGTFLRLRGPHGLASGDLIRLGDELLRFEIG